jgi:hypothetical protein
MNLQILTVIILVQSLVIRLIRIRTQLSKNKVVGLQCLRVSVAAKFFGKKILLTLP